MTDEDDDDVVMEPAPDPAWQPGSFAFFFFYVGQGNCCLAVCPDKTLVMIDCGSLRGYPTTATQEIRNKILLYSPTGLVNYLILTHADRDHYNKIDKVFAGFTIGTIIVSAAVSQSPLYWYCQSFISRKIYEGRTLAVNRVQEVTLNDTMQRLRTWAGPRFDTAAEAPITTPFYTVCGVAGASPWSVQIIAGNVGYTESVGLTNAKTINSASLVTLFTLNGQTYINPGDATLLTETFMLKAARRAAIQNMTIALVAHHGSSDEANTKTYVDYMNAQNVVVSVEKQEKNFFVPKSSIMNFYGSTTRIQSTMPLHPVDTWVLAPNYSPGTYNEAYQILDGWPAGSYTTRGNFYVLKVIPASGVYAVYPMKGFMLTRTSTQMNVINNGASAGQNVPVIYFTFNPA